MNDFRYRERKTPRVLSHPVRDPVNMQAVRIIRPAAWYEMPPPVNPQTEIDALKKENAKMKTINANLAIQCSSLQRQVAHLRKQSEDASARLDEAIARREKEVEGMFGHKKAHAAKILNKTKAFRDLENSDKTYSNLEIKVVP